MKSDFILLGLRDDATLDDAARAYNYWKRKYQAADFDDEPAYAKRKIKALGIAYENVCRDIAGYVPEHVLPEEESSGSQKTPGGKLKKLKRKTEQDSFERVSGQKQGIDGFLNGLKAAGTKFLDELDLDNLSGLVVSSKSFHEDDDYDYDEVD